MDSAASPVTHKAVGGAIAGEGRQVRVDTGGGKHTVGGI